MSTSTISITSQGLKTLVINQEVPSEPELLNASHIISSCSWIPKMHRDTDWVPNNCHNNFPVLFWRKKSCNEEIYNLINDFYRRNSKIYVKKLGMNQQVRDTFGCMYNQNLIPFHKEHGTTLEHMQSSFASQHWKNAAKLRLTVPEYMTNSMKDGETLVT